MFFDFNSSNVFPVASDSARAMQFKDLCDRTIRDGIRPTAMMSLQGWEKPGLDGHLLTIQDLEMIRKNVLERLGELESVSSENAFDRYASSIVYEELNMLPIQAADSALWESLAMFIFPDVVYNRWFKSTGKLTERALQDRYRSGRRNGLWRWWFRRRIFSERLEATYEYLLKQDLVQQILERPSLSSHPVMTEGILMALAARYEDAENDRYYYRGVMKEASFLSALSVPQLMTPEEISQHLVERIDAARAGRSRFTAM